MDLKHIVHSLLQLSSRVITLLFGARENLHMIDRCFPTCVESVSAFLSYTERPILLTAS